MPRIAKWRGIPELTDRRTTIQIFELAKLSRDDVFYDLGCGHGWVCIWAAQRCKYAKGIESHPTLVKQACKNVEKSGLKNVEIIHNDFIKHRFPDADVLYCVTDLDFDDLKRWNMRKIKKNLRIVTIGPPPIPIKPISSRGIFYLTRFPFELAKNSEDWYSTVIQKRNGKWKDVVRRLRKGANVESYHSIQDLRKQFKKYFKHK